MGFSFTHQQRDTLKWLEGRLGLSGDEVQAAVINHVCTKHGITRTQKKSLNPDIRELMACLDQPAFADFCLMDLPSDLIEAVVAHTDPSLVAVRLGAEHFEATRILYERGVQNTKGLRLMTSDTFTASTRRNSLSTLERRFNTSQAAIRNLYRHAMRAENLVNSARDKRWEELSDDETSSCFSLGGYDWFSRRFGLTREQAEAAIREIFCRRIRFRRAARVSEEERDAFVDRIMQGESFRDAITHSGISSDSAWRVWRFSDRGSRRYAWAHRREGTIDTLIAAGIAPEAIAGAYAVSEQDILNECTQSPDTSKGLTEAAPPCAENELAADQPGELEFHEIDDETLDRLLRSEGVGAIMARYAVDSAQVYERIRAMLMSDKEAEACLRADPQARLAPPPSAAANAGGVHRIWSTLRGIFQ